MVFPVFLLWKTLFYPGTSIVISINSLSTTTLGNAAEKTITSHSGKCNTSWKSHPESITLPLQINWLCLVSFVSSRSKGITSNETYSFLITLDVDIGELIMIKFKWENRMVWSNVWNTVQTIIPWGRESLHLGLALKSIRVKVGETQQRWVLFQPPPNICWASTYVPQFNTCIYLMKWALFCSNGGIQMLRKVQWPSWVPKATGGRTKIYTQVSAEYWSG